MKPERSSPSSAPMLRLAAFLPRSAANGPGVRAVVWVQGCHRRCPGCGNAAFQPFDGGERVSVDAVWRRIEAAQPVDGITFSGGEPFEQAAALAELARRAHAAGLTVVVYTGYTREELRRAPGDNTACSLGPCARRSRTGPALDDAHKGLGYEGFDAWATLLAETDDAHKGLGYEGFDAWAALLAETDLLIDGPYVAELSCAAPLRASSNQQLHFLTGRIRPAEVESVPAFEAIIADGEVVLTGCFGEVVRW